VFNGLALAIAKARKMEQGLLTVTARAEGLEMGSATIITKE
jgi:hypothetical protein